MPFVQGWLSSDAGLCAGVTQNSGPSAAAKMLCLKEQLFPSSHPKALRTALESTSLRKQAALGGQTRDQSYGNQGAWSEWSYGAHSQVLFHFSSPGSETNRWYFVSRGGCPQSSSEHNRLHLSHCLARFLLDTLQTSTAHLCGTKSR